METVFIALTWIALPVVESTRPALPGNRQQIWNGTCELPLSPSAGGEYVNL
jgi:hypothetical protein